MVSSQSPDHVQVGGTANSGHFCSKILCQLDRICTDTSGSAIDHDLLPAHACQRISFPQQAQCRRRTDGESGGFLIPNIGRFDCQHRLFGKTFILGVGAKVLREGGGEYLVAYFELFYIPADGFHFPGELHTVDRLFWFGETQRESSGEPEQGRDSKAPHSKVPGCDGRRVHFDQDLIVFGGWFLDLFELKDFRSAVLSCYDCFHLKSFLLKLRSIMVKEGRLPERSDSVVEGSFLGKCTLRLQVSLVFDPPLCEENSCFCLSMIHPKLDGFYIRELCSAQ